MAWHRLILAASAAVALMAAGCDDDDHDHGDHSHSGIVASDVMAGCQHFEFGPHHDDVNAGADAAGAPTVMPHNHYRLTVPAAGGLVSLMAPGEGIYYIMLSASAASVAVTDGAGAGVEALETQAPAEACAAAARLAQYQLAAGTYTLRIEGAESVELVVHGPIGGDHQHGADGGHQHGDMDGGVHEHGDGGHEHAGDAGHEHADDAGHEHADDAGHHHADDAGHEHADDAGHHHEGDGGHEHPPVPDGGASADPAVNAYCLCMLAACHDPFHDRWGVSDEDALAGCAAEAGALAPGTEGDATGDTLACRITACDAADLNGDQATCPAALGGDVCQ
ncbi:MAG: hypothetical protein H6704_29230 [Myxococcales bacterium]|nr:hypothetical protein [Myxococcales bacterium]